VRVSERLGVAKLAAIHSEHTPSGAHYSIAVDFPQWVPTEILRAAAMLRVDEVFAPLPERLRTNDRSEIDMARITIWDESTLKRQRLSNSD
jgi:hypothetical protein